MKSAFFSAEQMDEFQGDNSSLTRFKSYNKFPQPLTEFVNLFATQANQ